MLNLSVPVWIGLLGTPLLIASGQVLFKLTSATTGGLDARGLAGLIFNPIFLAALVLYGIGTVIWIFVLKQVPLTIAYSFMGLTFCFVPLLALYFLGEPLTLRYLFGVALIVGGMVAINS
jgi:undecaprenyl phosphate-alpha-L-ara4N flippase subunit ArnE